MPWTRKEKIFCVTIYLEAKSFKTVQARKVKYFASLLIWRQNLSKLYRQERSNILRHYLFGDKNHSKLYRQERSNILRHYLFGDKIFQNCTGKILQEVLFSQLSPEKPNLSLNTQISSYKVSKPPQQEGRKSEIWQEVDSKISWQCECGARFCQKESEKVPQKMFPRGWSFTPRWGNDWYIYFLQISTLYIDINVKDNSDK